MKVFYLLRTVGAVGGLALSSAALLASPIYCINFDDGTNVAHSTVTLGVFNEVISGILDVTAGPYVGLYPIFLNPNAPSSSFSPSNTFFYDNILSAAANPQLSNPGLLFVAGGREINIYSFGPSSYVFDTFDGGGYHPGTSGNFFSSSVGACVPEAGAYPTAAIALLSGAGLLRLRRRK